MIPITDAIATTERSIQTLARAISRRSYQMSNTALAATEFSDIVEARKLTDAIDGDLRTIRSIQQQLKSANSKLAKLRNRKSNGITAVAR